MKALSSPNDRLITYRIEAARISYLMLKTSYEDLYSIFRKTEADGQSIQNTIGIYRHIWQVIDSSFRFFILANHIRGLKHKEERFQKAEIHHKIVSAARNFIQHLPNEISDIRGEVYPIMGSISWASEDLLKSYTISLGAIPQGTHTVTLPFDTLTGTLVGETILNVNNLAVKIDETYQILTALYSYLNDWLQTQNLLLESDSTTNLVTWNTSLNPNASSPQPATNQKRYLRFKIGPIVDNPNFKSKK